MQPAQGKGRVAVDTKLINTLWIPQILPQSDTNSQHFKGKSRFGKSGGRAGVLVEEKLYYFFHVSDHLELFGGELFVVQLIILTDWGTPLVRGIIHENIFYFYLFLPGIYRNKTMHKV